MPFPDFVPKYNHTHMFGFLTPSAGHLICQIHRESFTLFHISDLNLPGYNLLCICFPHTLGHTLHACQDYGNIWYDLSGFCSSELKYSLLAMAPRLSSLLASWETQNNFQTPTQCTLQPLDQLGSGCFSVLQVLVHCVSLYYPSPLQWTNAAVAAATSLFKCTFLSFVQCTQISVSLRDSNCPILNFAEFFLHLPCWESVLPLLESPAMEQLEIKPCSNLPSWILESLHEANLTQRLFFLWNILQSL